MIPILTCIVLIGIGTVGFFAIATGHGLCDEYPLPPGLVYRNQIARCQWVDQAVIGKDQQCEKLAIKSGGPQDFN